MGDSLTFPFSQPILHYPTQRGRGRLLINSTARLVVPIIASAILVGGILLLLRYFGLESRVITFLAWVSDAGFIGQLLFALCVALSVIFLLPGIVFTLGAGFLFGVVHGSFLIVLAETVGAIAALLLARYTLFDRVSEYIGRNEQLGRISESLEGQDWRFIAYIRMIPFFPFKLSNYFFGLTPVSMVSYVGGTFVGLWPITLFNVYLGSIAADLLSLSTAANPKSGLQWSLYLIGLIVSILMLVFLAKKAQKTMQKLDDRTTNQL